MRLDKLPALALEPEVLSLGMQREEAIHAHTHMLQLHGCSVTEVTGIIPMSQTQHDIFFSVFFFFAGLDMVRIYYPIPMVTYAWFDRFSIRKIEVDVQ